MPPSDDKADWSKVEKAKQAGRFLRGSIDEVLSSDQPALAHDDAQLLKFHGAYQQYDRDQRKAGGQGKAERAYQYMVRVRIPAVRLTATQYLDLDRITDRLASGTLRITSRQGLQYHGVLKRNLKATLAGINQTLLTTLAACGDVSRNVMMSPAPPANEAESRALDFALEVASQLRPASRAYHEIWLGEQKLESGAPENEEPFYGQQYLPRKFKVGVALPGDNSADIYTQDVGIIPLIEDGRLRGANLLVGGGLGMTHLKADTFARLATRLGSVEPEAVVEATITVASIFRDFGNRKDRRHARLKYLVRDWGMDRFKAEFVERFSSRLHPWAKCGELTVKDHIGSHRAADGSWYYGVYVENGRIGDTEAARLRSGLRALVNELQPGVVLTPQQNLLLTGLTGQQVERIGEILDDHGIARPERVSPARRVSLACVALPTCGLAIAEAERVAPSVMDELEALLASLGLANEAVSVRMTGCPNGCVRPYTADIGLVGRAANAFDIYVGGRPAGDRLTDLYAEKVPLGEIVETLRPLLTSWKDDRQAGESFGDYYQRVHHRGPALGILTGAKGTP